MPDETNLLRRLAGDDLDAAVETQAMRALLERGIPLCLLTYGGYYLGRATGLESRNVELRVAQHRAAADEAFCLSFARGVVVSKIKNARTMLRRNHAAPEAAVLPELDQLARKAAGAPSLPSLLGIEGTAARVYFGAFAGMLKGGRRWARSGWIRCSGSITSRASVGRRWRWI